MNELIAFEPTYVWSVLDPWFYSKRPVNPNFRISFDKILPVSSILRLQQNLKRLRIEFQGTRPVLDFINSLQELEELDITFDCGQGLYTFVSPKLRVLKAFATSLFHRMNEPKMILEFKSSKLEAICCEALNHLLIENPLEVKYYEGEDYDEDEIGQFENLECLRLDFVEYIDPDILSRFASLKELRMNWANFGYNPSFPNDALAMNTVEQILKKKLVLRRIDFRLYLQGVEIKDKNLFVDNTYLNDQDFRLRNYQLLDQAFSYTDELAVDYCGLVQLKSAIPPDFFTKFPRINKIKVKENVANGDQLIWFLKNAGDCFESLHLKNTALSQAHYNRLPELTSLRYLKINEEETAISYKFILKMKNLRTFTAKQEFPDAFSLAMRMFKRSKVIGTFEWQVAGDGVRVGRARGSSDRRKHFSLLWFNQQSGPLSFHIKLQLESITVHELACIYSQINKTGVATRKRFDVVMGCMFSEILKQQGLSFV